MVYFSFSEYNAVSAMLLNPFLLSEISNLIAHIKHKSQPKVT